MYGIILRILPAAPCLDSEKNKMKKTEKRY